MSRKRKKKIRERRTEREKLFLESRVFARQENPREGSRVLMEGFAITPHPGEGFGVSGVQQGPRGEGRDRSLLLAHGACRVTRVGLSTCGSVGVGTGRGAGHIAELTGTRTSARVGGRWE